MAGSSFIWKRKIRKRLKKWIRSDEIEGENRTSIGRKIPPLNEMLHSGIKPAILLFRVCVIVQNPFLCCLGWIILYRIDERFTLTCLVENKMAGNTFFKGVSGHLSVLMNCSGEKIFRIKVFKNCWIRQADRMHAKNGSSQLPQRPYSGISG